MTAADIKKEILKKIEPLEDEETLKQILNLLKENTSTQKPIDATKHIEKLFSENDELLKRLS